MKINKTVTLPNLRSIVSGTYFGIPLARYMEGSVVRSSHLGPFAERRALKSYRKAEERRIDVVTNPIVKAIQQAKEEIARGERASIVIDTDDFGEQTDIDGNPITK